MTTSDDHNHLMADGAAVRSDEVPPLLDVNTLTYSDDGNMAKNLRYQKSDQMTDDEELSDSDDGKNYIFCCRNNIERACCGSNGVCPPS